MQTESKTLAEALPEEIERCSELLAEYEALGPIGAFGATTIRQAITNAQKATRDRDTVAMLRAHNALAECE